MLAPGPGDGLLYGGRLVSQRRAHAGRRIRLPPGLPAAGQPRAAPDYREPFVYGNADSYDYFLRAGSLADMDERLLSTAQPISPW